MAEEAHGAVFDEDEDDDRWDYWGNWILPWLWKCVGILTINVPSALIGKCLKGFMKYLTGNSLKLGH